MRILHVTPYWEDAWAYGGIPRVAGALVRHQAGAGHHVTVCTTDAHSRDRRMPASPARLDIDLRVFQNRSNRLAYDWQCFTPVGLHRYLRDHAHAFDVAHLHACRNLPGAFAAHFLDRYGVPYVLAPNGTAPVIERRRLAKHAFDWLVGHKVLRNAAAVIAVSESERRQLLALGVEDARIHVFPNPVELGEFTPAIERGRFRRRAGFASETLITFLGKITPRKRLDVLVRAFARLPADARLVLAGNDMGGLDSVQSLARDLGVRDRMHIAGLLEDRDRLEALADADVVVYAGEDEVFGLVALEAILSGTPVVVAGDSGCGEIVSRLGGGLVTPAGDDRAVAAAIGTILSAPTAWREAAAEAAERVRSDYGADRIANRLVDLYERVAVANGGRVSVNGGRVFRPGEPVENGGRVFRPGEPVEDGGRVFRPGDTGVSFVVPVKNGMPGLARTIAAIEVQADGRPMEIIVVDDRSDDGSAGWLSECARQDRIRLVSGAGRGASAALNLGVSLARYPIVCQVDQDVELLPGWMSRLVDALERDPGLGAVEGQYIVNSSAPVLARVMALDLEQRYQRLKNGNTSHVCTGNTAFRAGALRDAGGFDESLGYGNDADASQRLVAAGWRLAHCSQARSFHAWRESLSGYLRQQYGFGYGRVDLVSRDRRRVAGDSVAPKTMMAHPIVMMGGLASLLIAAVIQLSGADARPAFLIGAAALALLAAERAVAGARAFFRFGDPAALLFPAIHFFRDLSWVAAIGVWSFRSITGRAARPSDSMRPRPAIAPDVNPTPTGFIPRSTRTIGIIPSHNEAATISAVIADVRQCQPELDLLVVDDGSTDNGVDLVARAGVRWIELPERMGVGTAMRTGLRYARLPG